MYGWNQESDRETVAQTKRLLLSAATGKMSTAKKTNPKVLLPTKVCTLDDQATAWIQRHQQ
jgi:hypothetical protein